jgi:inner membrane protein
MDNLTHSLVGWALAETGLKRRTRKGLAACVLAANMPDIDVFFGWSAWEPLATHRGFTHGLVGGVLLMPPLLAALLILIDRWQVRRGKVFGDAPALHAGWLAALSYLGALTHPLLDLQNVYAVQLFSLASTRWFHTDGLFIVSPWLLAILGVGIWLSRRRRQGRPAQIALVAAMAFIAINIGVSLQAYRAVRSGAGLADNDRIFASPEPIAFWRRDMIWRQSGQITFARYDPLNDLNRLAEQRRPVRDNMTLPVVRQAAEITAETRKFLAWSQMPIASVVYTRCAAIVTFGDARFSGPALSRNFNVVATVPMAVAGCRPPR